MSKAVKGFGSVQDARVKSLVEGAEIHKETHHITFKLPSEMTEEKELKFKNEVEVVQHAVELVNGYGLAVEAATSQIAHDQFGDTKHEIWDGRLEVFEGLTMNSDIRLRETVGEDVMFGITQTFVDHPHSQEMVDWYSKFQASNTERAQKLFK